MWFCYHCQKVTNHKGDECCQRAGGSGQHHRGRGRGHGRGHNPRGKEGAENKDHPGVSHRGKVNKRKFHRGFYQKTNASGEEKVNNSNKPKAKQAGMVAYQLNSSDKDDQIIFIVDSGATEHIVNKSLILSDFERCSGAVIESANKNRAADIEIDGKGDLFLQSNVLKEEAFKLTNVIAAKDIVENLIFLRRFADAGLAIHIPR